MPSKTPELIERFNALMRDKDDGRFEIVAGYAAEFPFRRVWELHWDGERFCDLDRDPELALRLARMAVSGVWAGEQGAYLARQAADEAMDEAAALGERGLN